MAWEAMATSDSAVLTGPMCARAQVREAPAETYLSRAAEVLDTASRGWQPFHGPLALTPHGFSTWSSLSGKAASGVLGAWI